MDQGNGFKDPLGVKKRESGKDPWNFKAPIYDRRSSGSVSAGDDYGSGHRNPVGHEGPAKDKVDTMPMKARMFKSGL